MKKFILVVLSLMIVIPLVACNNNRKMDNDIMVIKESEFSKETQEVLKIIGDEIVFFDYTINETIKSISIDIWTYENDGWVNSGKTYGNIESDNGRIAIRINDNFYEIFSINENGHTKASYKRVVDFSESKAITNSRLSNPTEIKIGKEIPLWVRLGTDKTSMKAGIIDDFRKADCNAGVAVTITFSDENID